jgi:hypothetical protein
MLVAPSRASIAIRRWTNANTQNALADRLTKRLGRKVPQSTVSSWSRGRVPEAQAMLALQEELGINPADFFKPASAREIARVEKSVVTRRRTGTND